MAVIPGEVFITGVDVTRLMEEASRQGLRTDHIRKIENGYMVPASVRAAFEKERAPARRNKRARNARKVDF
jgi:hypothetical protein